MYTVVNNVYIYICIYTNTYIFKYIRTYTCLYFHIHNLYTDEVVKYFGKTF